MNLSTRIIAIGVVSATLPFGMCDDEVEGALRVAPQRAKSRRWDTAIAGKLITELFC
jgi:hypothetical protein